MALNDYLGSLSSRTWSVLECTGKCAHRILGWVWNFVDDHLVFSEEEGNREEVAF